MDRERVYKIAVWSVAAVLFGITGWYGGRFIQAAGESAAGIRHGASDAAPMQPETALGVPSNPFGGIAPVSDAAEPEGSTGEDVAIQAGELSFETGEPHIRLRLQNTGSFTVMTVYADVSLYLDDAKKPAAQAKAVALPLAGGLAAGAETDVSVPVLDAAWSSSEVMGAGKRRVLAKIAAVASQEQPEIGLPQKGTGSWINETAPPATPKPQPESESESAAQTDAVRRPRIVEIPPEPPTVEEILREQRVPTGETGVISYERTESEK